MLIAHSVTAHALAVMLWYAARPVRLPADWTLPRGRAWTLGLQGASMCAAWLGWMWWERVDGQVVATLASVASLTTLAMMFVIAVQLWPRATWMSALFLPGVLAALTAYGGPCG